MTIICLGVKPFTLPKPCQKMCENPSITSNSSKERRNFLSVCYKKWKQITDPEESLRCFLLIQNTMVRLQNEAEKEGDVWTWNEEEQNEDLLPYEMNKETEIFNVIGDNEENSSNKRSFDEMTDDEFHDAWNKITATAESLDYEETWNILEDMISPKKRKEETDEKCDLINNNDVPSTSQTLV